MNNDWDEENGLLDKDPALDFILYQDMSQEDKKPENKTGCLGLTLIFILPLGTLFCCFIKAGI